MKMPHAKTQRRKRLLFASLRLCVSLFLLLQGAQATPGPDAAATVVVFNERDAESIALAGYYAEKRGIPWDHLVPLSCSLEEWVPRAEYDRTIAAPLRKAFLAHGWWKTEADLEHGRVIESRIRYVALMRGIPLKAGAEPGYAGDRPLPANSPLNHSEAAVDSELAVLGLATRQISGPVENPIYEKDGGTEPAPASPPWLLRVCRLDAAQPATVRRMIDDALAAEAAGLRGLAYIDARNLTPPMPMAEGDAWLRQAAADVAQALPCVLENTPALFPEHYPMRAAALYLGWYTGEVAGVFKDPAFRFAPGAVAVHLHSFSADSLREPLRGWCAPLLERGAAATLGNVYEPYLPLTPHLDVFEARLRSGRCFAEAAYASQPVLSWMTTFIGDPLYRPFAKPCDAPETAVYREGAARWSAQGRAAGEALLLAQGRKRKSGLILEGLGLLQSAAKDTPAALAAWSQAGQYYHEDADRIRCALHSVALLRAGREPEKALALVRETLARFPQADAAECLREIERELAPPPPSSSPSPTPR